MFITKESPNIEKDGNINENIYVKDGVLYITKKEDDINLKFTNGKWYSFGGDNKWWYLGIGANPSFTMEKENIINEEIFDNVFEEVMNE